MDVASARPDDVRRIGRTDEQLQLDSMRLLAHDFNNPLTAIRILAEMLRDELVEPEMRQDVIDILEAADLATALMDGMGSMLRLATVEDDYTWFPIDLVEVLRQVVDRPALRRNIRLDLPRELQMGGDRNGLHRAFTDVLVNARRLCDGDQQVLVFVVDRDTAVEVRVRHAMPDVQPRLRDRLFEMYGAVELRQNRIPVSATGLVYAHRVVENHGGTMAFESGTPGTVDLVITLHR
ncbi:MAG: HAMP domain-containing sensor histidine kinase [Myxococcota bacterium]